MNPSTSYIFIITRKAQTCVQLNGDLVYCMMRVQNAAQTWQLMDLPHKYVRYRYPVHVYVRRERTVCVIPDIPI